MERAISLAPKNITNLLYLAYAYRASGDSSAAIQAAQRVLEIDPHNLRALILIGDELSGSGETRRALSYYTLALSVASGVARLPDDLAREITRIRAVAERSQADFEALIVSRMRAAGFDGLSSSPRVNRSVDILLGRQRIYVMEPRRYYFPGLATINFYPRDAFDWVEHVESQTAEITSALNTLWAKDDVFRPYLQDDGRPITDNHGMVGNADWGAFYFWRDGTAQGEALAAAPAIARAMEGVPLCHIPGVSPSVLFSRLKPGAAIPPHNGLVNIRLICHLPLIVPQGCGFRVGDETREWETGKLLIFDDSIEHEAWNRSTQERVVLLFDIWRPDLSVEEREMVSVILGTIDALKSGD
jgi:hypothetical protein